MNEAKKSAPAGFNDNQIMHEEYKNPDANQIDSGFKPPYAE